MRHLPQGHTMQGKRLLFSVTKDDFELQTFTSGGKGGQHQNRVCTGVRIIHKASGARGEARDSRSQIQNREAALERLLETPEWKAWHKMEVARRLGVLDRAEQATEEMMQPRFLKVEARTENGWQELGE